MNGTFVVSQKELLSLLNSMQPICNRRTTLDVTESILFHVTPKELTLKGTDLEISLQANMHVESDLLDAVTFLISGKRIFDIVKELDGQISFLVTDNHVKIVASGVDVTLNIKDAALFPPFPERIANLMDLESDFLLSLLNKVAFLIPSNNTNAALNGLLVELDSNQLSLVTTDGHCLARVTTPKYTLAEEKKWLMPKRAVLELKKLLEGNSSQELFLGICGNQLVFSGKNFNFFTKLIADQFPAYKPVLDQEGFHGASLAREGFLKTLRRTQCLLAGQFLSTRFKFQPGEMQVSLHNQEVGSLEENLSLELYDGSSFESRFYSPYLFNGLQVFPGENVNFSIKNGAKPIIFTAQAEHYNMTFLVMPVSLAEQS